MQCEKLNERVKLPLVIFTELCLFVHALLFCRNHRIALYDTFQADVSLSVTGFVDISEELGCTGLIRSMCATDTDLYVGTVSGNEGIIVFSAWPVKILK